MKKNLRLLILTPPSYTQTIQNYITKHNITSLCNYKIVEFLGNQKNIDFNVFGPGSANILLQRFTPPDHISKALLQNKEVRWIHTLSAGIDNLQVSSKSFANSENPFDNKELMITNAKGAFSKFLAEFVIFQILFHGKKGAQWLKNKQNAIWQKETVKYVGLQTLGIVGYGDIGYQIARMAKNSFGMKVIALKRNLNEISDEKKHCTDEIVDMKSFDYLLENSDYVVNVLPLTDETYHLFNLDKFKKMKESACFVNVGRGQSVVEKDQIFSLENGVISAAALDVFEKEPLSPESKLWNLENVFITPHSCDNIENQLDFSQNIWKESLEKFNNSNKSMNNIVNLERQY